VAERRGEYGRAAALLRESLSLSRDIGAQDVVAVGLGDLAAVVVALGQPLRGARLGGTAEALREALGVPLAPAARSDQDQAVRALRSTLGEEAFAAAWAEGRAMPLEEAIALALDEQDEDTWPGRL
jgi:non-specific serine/threonine protein kinase